ncbi:MAG: hypothetical protein RH917_09445 [Lacipirellulaceae bacterium]
MSCTARACLFAVAIIATSTAKTNAARYDGQLTLTVTDEQTGKPLACRIELRDARGRLVRTRAEGAIPTDAGLYFDGEVVLKLRRGNYQFLIEAGPEYRTRPGTFEIQRRAEDAKQVSVLRRIDMKSESWWSGDLDVREKLDHVPLLMRARGVDFVPVTMEWTERGRKKSQKVPKGFQAVTETVPSCGPWAEYDRSKTGGLLTLETNLRNPSDPTDVDGPYVVGDATAWLLPVWLAEDRLSAIMVIDRYSQGFGKNANEFQGRLPDRKRFPGKLGYGRWCEHIYHHALNCGIYLAPAAGSGSGANGNAIGANRTYVQLEDYQGQAVDEQFDKESWLNMFYQGRVFVTNGPLLRTMVDGDPPGNVTVLSKGEQRDFQIALNLAFYEATQVEYLEILKNGKAIHQVRLDELAKQKGRLPKVPFDDSGWFAVRAVTNNTEFYQYAHTGPYFVEKDSKPLVQRESVQFFIDWLDAAEEEFAGDEPTLAKIESARPFWTELLKQARP